ncbi:hypothetical protein YK48G_04430 [Lentilactobacillus fungorum]|uniref:DUF3892 domain-containing protein n=1 Tax=Lentilactobacillus fungorum TaxID=2201250 RepID=A0ABQ3VWH5_9LACO|nr:DUF3892 domain-containing protein [Lentilactobacillus fungorum]GHP13018.1 hypothetical protein YK48G_04430 [Lentilactobacillus fungorum]
MEHKIVKVHTENDSATKESEIVSVELANGDVETKEQVVAWLDLGNDYFFTNSAHSKVDVKVVHPHLPKKPYIQTDPNATTSDNLLSLPRF